ncbi:alkaline shock response membrane anchor protein AmaP [Sulfoacidibacillus thermotolerans]|uniref:Alkaline shock response membrane anchor protein AmaP n=1 Tax=Sulfoacidibacillus thermotolerans TaxID=1765684 RepID=A0A2U3DBX0_SULT2|nr:alkaline shock response membrane anchor protein AmaP [Sulfoacidibacillus thermotolerans]PWI58787.1 hypothetical protein BM613_01455 [Sulfoacidibacillus thermotolerans]
MSLIDRLLLRFFSLLVLVNAVWYSLGLLGVPFVINTSIDPNVLYTAVWIDFALLLVLSLRFLLYRVLHRRPLAFIKDSESGEVRIGYDTVKEIAHRAAKQIRGVERLQTKISADPQGLVVSLNVRSLPAIDVTAMSEQIQHGVAEAIRNYTSLSVAKVHVHIVALAPDAASK